VPFDDRIKSSLTLKVGDAQAHSVPGGNLKNLEVRVHAWGFEVALDFWLVSKQSQSEDTLFADFLKADPTVATLTVDRAFDEVGLTAAPLVLKGLLTEKAVTERAFEDVQGSPVLQRHYRVRFADRAQVLWAQHFPTSLYVDKSLKDLLEDNKPDGVTLAYVWAAAQTSWPILTLGLGADGNGASYLDFVHWLCDREHVGLFYAPGDDRYTFRDAKDDAGEATELPREDVAEVEVRFPALRRQKKVILNSHVGASTARKEVANEKAVTGVRQDHLLTTPIENDVTARATLEGKRVVSREHELLVRYGRYPGVSMAPGLRFKFGEDWSDKTSFAANTYRCYALEWVAHALVQDPIDQLDEDTNRYHFELSARLELASDTVFHRPPYRRPHWPFQVEGTIVSEVGEETEKTYQIYTDSQTSLDQYKVKIPLFDGQVAVIPYEPILVPGHFYFPGDKGDRVLVSFEHRRAWIKRFLDWHPGARLPKETQGDHLLFGKKADSQTSVKHAYADGKPVLQIQRTSGADLQTLKISDGSLWMEVKETEGGGGGGSGGGA
jgi:hypothetical protein